MDYEIHYGEIGLKGKNRYLFENKLIQNIKKMLIREKIDSQISKKYGYIELKANEKATEILEKVFGIRYFYFGLKIKRDYNLLKKEILKFFKTFDKNKTFKINVNRNDKSYEKTSVEIGKELGLFVSKELNIEGEIINPDFLLNVNVFKDYFYIAFKRVEGLGGLPVGITGKSISLMSTGIDSPVAIYLMMKRGVTPIIYHALCEQENKNEKEKVFEKIIFVLQTYCPTKIQIIKRKLDLKPKFTILQKINETKYNCLYFKYKIIHDAEEIAKNFDALCITTGDNLAQVASQTLENLNAQRYGLKIQVYSPLITYDKEEIIKVARKINTYNLSIQTKEDYPFLPKHPVLNTKIDDFLEIIKKIEKEKK